MNIRKATKQDLSALVPLLKSMWLEHANSAPNVLNLKYLSELDVQEYLLKYLGKAENNFVLVAEEDGVVGCCRAEVIKPGKMFAKDKILYVDDLVVGESHRGKGVATKLLEEVEKIAKEKGVGLLQSRIYKFNKPSKKLFEKLEYDEVYSEYFKKLG